VLDEPFLGTEAIARGLLTRHQVYGRRYRRLFPDVYLSAGAATDLAARSRGAYLLVRETGGVMVGYSAAVLLGADCAPIGTPAEMRTPGRVRAHPGLRADQARIDPIDIVERSGCRVTSPERTAWDLARRLPVPEAVVALDCLARLGEFAPVALLARRSREPGTRGCRRLDEVVRLADPRAESPPESRLRVALVRAGLPHPEVQYRINDGDGIVLARADLAYPAPKLAIEYDGANHYTRERGEGDRARDTELAVLGWHTLRIGRDGLAWLPQTVRQIADLLAQRTARPPHPRRG
jgi:very-short-patch-repair endonuclease